MAPQHDYILDNQNGAQFRADLNLALEAIATVNSGAAAPTTTYAYQYWADTTSGYLKQRDASNADWIVRGKLAADYGQAGQVLTSAGADEPAIWTSITEDGAWTVAEDGTNYTFTGNGFDGTETNPTIYVTRGSVYNFTNADTVNGFQIQSVAGLGGAAYTDGTVNNPALAPNTSTVETLVWTVQMDAPSELYYHSTTNAGPGGKIYVLNNIPSSIAATPEIVLEDSLGATAGIEQTAFIRDNDEFKIQTRSATDVVVSTDYNVTLGASGATSHQWSIDNTEAVRIDSSGRLLVGTSTASANSSLVLEGHSANGLAQSIVYLKRGNTPGAASSFLGIINFSDVTEGIGAEIRADSGAAWVTTPGSESYPGRLVFSTTADGASSPTERMRITSSGNVGIGASNPTAELQVNGRIAAGDGSASLPSHTFASGGGNGLYYAGNGEVGLSTGGSEKLRITFSGNVGIGTSSPGYKFDILGGAENTYLRIRANSTDTHISGILFGDADSAAPGQINYAHNDSSLRFTVNAAERMRIDSSGRLLVGTSSNLSGLAGYSLQMAGTVAQSSLLQATYNAGAGGPVHRFYHSRSAAVGTNTILQDSDSLGKIEFLGSDGAGIVTAAAIQALVDGTPGLNDMPGRLVFRTTADGASSTTERMRIDSSGNVGIGATNPSANLHVKATAAALYIDDPASTNPLRITQTGTSAEVVNVAAGDIEFGLANDGNILFVNGSAKNERMRITSSGNVGIGTSSPNTKLHLAAATPIFTIEDTSGATAGVEATCILRNNDAFELQNRNSNNTFSDTFYAVALDANGASQHTWKTGNTERMRIDSSGNVGIGTSSPDEPLDVRGGAFASNQDFGIQLGVPTGEWKSALKIKSTGSGVQRLSLDVASDNSGGTIEALSLVGGGNAGNVGIGTTNPTELLHLSESGNLSILLERTDGSPSEAEFANLNSTTLISNNANGIQFRTGATPVEVARFNADGHLGLGVSNPSQTLVVQDDETNPIQVAVRSTQTSASCRLGVGSTGNSVGVWADNTVLESRSGGLSIGTNNAGSDVTIYTTASRTAKLTVKSDGIVNIANAPTYADDTAAGTGGLVAGDVYKTSTGELRIKL